MEENVVTKQPGPAATMPGAIDDRRQYGEAPPPTQNYTTVVMQQQQTTQQVIRLNRGQKGWDTGLFGCCEDCASCWCVLLCPECYLCYLSQKMGEGCYMPMFVPSLTAVMGLRTTVRAENGIKGSVCDDFCLSHCCCTVQCVLCQVARQYDISESQNDN